MKVINSIDNELNQKAIKCVEKLRRDWGLKNEPITNIEFLIKSRNFLLLKFPNDVDISGMYMEKKDRERVHGCIYVNNKEPLGRQYFTIAHELYHAIFEKSVHGICYDDQEDSVEKVANKFASHLLIPRHVLANELLTLYNKKNLGRVIYFEDIFKIQSIFAVSFQAIVFAIYDLKNYSDYKNLIPRNINDFKKYFKPIHWDELSKLSKEHNIKLNLFNPNFEFPTDFMNTLIHNYKKGRIELDDIQDIFDFFETPLKI